MPTVGYRTITIREDCWKILKEQAEKTHRSVPKFIEYLVDKYLKEPTFRLKEVGAVEEVVQG